MKIPFSTPLYAAKMEEAPLLFYTYATKEYHPFAVLYPLFALVSNPRSIVEVCLSDPYGFVRNYPELLDFYNEIFPGRVLYTYINQGGLPPHSVRFLVQPQSRARHVYIGDVDILLLEEDILAWHLRYMEEFGLEFSNTVRKGQEKLTGLHCIEYDKMFPALVPDGVNLRTISDEGLLYKLMAEKGFTIPPVTDLTHRPVHGLHISFFSRPPLPTLTTNDRLAVYPSWYGQSDETGRFIKDYLALRYSAPITDFMKRIRDDCVKLRQLIQIIDMFCAYCRDLPDTLKNE